MLMFIHTQVPLLCGLHAVHARGLLLPRPEEVSAGLIYTYNNIMCPDGSYTWVLRFKVLETDEIKEYHGNLTIIR